MKIRHFQCKCKEVRGSTRNDGKGLSVGTECHCNEKMFGKSRKYKTVIIDASPFSSI